MTSIAQPNSNTFSRISTPTKLVLLAVVLFIISIRMCATDLSFFHPMPVYATVLAKAPLGVRHRNGTMQFVMAVRRPDGSMVDVQTSFSNYSQTAVGGKWVLMESDSDRGRPMPVSTLLFIAAAVTMLMSAICCVGFAIARL